MLMITVTRLAWYHRRCQRRQGSRSSGDRGGAHVQPRVHSAGRAEAAAAQEAAGTRAGGLWAAAQQTTSQHTL